MYKYSKTIEENGYVRNQRKSYDCIPPHAKWLMYENQMKMHEKKAKKTLEPIVYTGYDAFKNLGLIERFICNKMKITRDELELFLFVYPMNYFTKTDYQKYAYPYVNCSMKSMVNKGHFTPIYKKETLRVPEGSKKHLADIFTLSLNAKRAVNMFYKMINGELKPYQFGTSNYTNSETKNKIVRELLQELREQM